jgi:YD repeat-containing protein
VTDPLGRKTDFSYDSAGNVTSITRLATTGDAVTTSFTYEPTFSQVATITDPLSHTTDFDYDALGRLTMITDPLGHETTFTYNTAGQPVTISNDASETVTLGYERGDLVSITNPLSHSTLRYVDAAGRLLRSLDPLGRTTTYEYNALNLVTKVIDALAGQTTFTFLSARGAPPPLAGPRRVRASRRPQALDGNGNRLTLTGARSKTTTWTYADMDRVETRTDPLSRDETFTYNENGAILTWTDRKGQVTSYTYDALDRQTFVGFGTTGSPPSYASTITTTYDDGDRPTEIVDSVAGT